MAFDHRIEMKRISLEQQLTNTSSEFISKLSSDELMSLLHKLQTVEDMVRRELRNTKKF